MPGNAVQWLLCPRLQNGSAQRSACRRLVCLLLHCRLIHEVRGLPDFLINFSSFDCKLLCCTRHHLAPAALDACCSPDVHAQLLLEGPLRLQKLTASERVRETTQQRRDTRPQQPSCCACCRAHLLGHFGLTQQVQGKEQLQKRTERWLARGIFSREWQTKGFSSRRHACSPQ